MDSKVYDVAIIGAGVSGASIARQLSLYEISVALLEKEVDVSFGVSKANSGIIHAGFHHPTNSLKSKLEIQGNLMYGQLHNELHFPFKRVGVIVAAFSYEQMKTIEDLYAQGVANGVPLIEICSRDRILSLEPKLNKDVVGGLYAPTGGIVEPYRFIFALAESAKKNGVDIITSFKVSCAAHNNNLHEITAEDGRKIKAKYVINAAGLFADEVSRVFSAEEFEIIPRKGEYFLFERNSAAFPNHVIFPVPTKTSKGTLIIPTVEGTMMIGPTADECESKSDVSTKQENLDRIFSFAHNMISGITKRDIITLFAGLRPTLETDDFFIEISSKTPNFIQVAGIQSPGLTAAPAIGVYVKNLLKKAGLVLTEKVEYNNVIEQKNYIRNLTPYSADDLLKKDPAYGNIICRCERVSEAEIVEAIRNGHTTVDGIKFYTRSGMGRCQGGFCSYKILEIISRETGMPIHEITKRGGDSYFVKDKISSDKIV